MGSEMCIRDRDLRGTSSSCSKWRLEALNRVEQVTYLGSTLTVNCDLSTETQTHTGVNRASISCIWTSFSSCVPQPQPHRIHQNRRLQCYLHFHSSIPLSWTPYREHTKVWKPLTPNVCKAFKVSGGTKLRARATLRSIAEVMLIPSRSHTHASANTTTLGPRPQNAHPSTSLPPSIWGVVARVATSHSDHIKTALKKRHISPSDLEALVSDRDVWVAPANRAYTSSRAILRKRTLNDSADTSQEHQLPMIVSTSSVAAFVHLLAECGQRNYLRKHNQPQT